MSMMQKIQNESDSRIRFCAEVALSCTACRRPGWVTTQLWMMMMMNVDDVDNHHDDDGDDGGGDANHD
eukprot:11040972-Karenia_brevis.AAC.1